MIFKTEPLWYQFVRGLTSVRIDVLAEFGTDQAQYDDGHVLFASYAVRIQHTVGHRFLLLLTTTSTAVSRIDYASWSAIAAYTPHRR